MKKNRINLFVLAALLMLGACAKINIDAPLPKCNEPEIDYSAPSFTAGTTDSDEPELRTSISSDKTVSWTKYDRVSVFNATVDNLQYAFTGETGSRTGTLQKVAGGANATGQALNAKYAVYPYNEANSISTDGVISLTLPATQTYSTNSFGQDANIMAAVSTGKEFKFKNAGAYLVVQLYGNATVKKIVLTSTNGEKLSGEADITFKNGVPSMTMRANASTSIALDCGAGVKLGKTIDKATKFWFVLPPVTFTQGLTIQVVCSEGSFAKQKITSGNIARNKIVTVAPFSVATTAGKYLGKIKESEIWNEKKVIDIAKSMSEDFDKYETLVNTVISTAKLIGVLESSDIKLSRIKYTTTDRDGNVIEASGIVAFPTSIPETSLFDRSTSYSKMVSVQHVTWGIDEAPSMVDVPYEAAAAFKKGNDVVVLADYLGYGLSRTGDLQHPYIHNELTGTACADLIEAAQEYVAQEGLTKDKSWKIELVGYSQGGSSTISTLFELEKRGYSNFGDIYSGGGPLNLPIFMNKFISEKDYDRTGFLAYLIRGIVYGDKLDIDFHNIFAEQVFASGAFNRFSTLADVSSWHRMLGKDITKILHPDFFVEGYNGNADILKLMSSLEYNSCSKYTPKNKSKIKLYHTPTDDIVPYASAKTAADAWGISIHNMEKESHIDAAAEFFGLYVSETIWNLIKDYI